MNKDIIKKISNEMTQCYANSTILRNLHCEKLPTKEQAARITRILRTLIFPVICFNAKKDEQKTATVLATLQRELINIITKCLKFKQENLNAGQINNCKREAEQYSCEILEKLPTVFSTLNTDVEASFQGDPAAKTREEVILSYPVIDAMLTYRFAHLLWLRDIPVFPRMLTEYMHSITNIDIHPGATIGESFFIDHATGVVIGETTVIGKHVKLYQGVTLGALSVESRDTLGKRHPTIEDHVTIYAGATILGGNTVIGAHSIIGGNVWLTSSVPKHSKIYYNPT